MKDAFDHAALNGEKEPPAAPELPYLPQKPPAASPAIALVGCGGIAHRHLAAYQALGLRVAALCDVNPERAETLRKLYYPDAAVFTDYRKLLRDDNIGVVDAATHPAERAGIIEDALCAGKHVLSQKPFVTDLDRGLQLVELADSQNLKLAVNQNGRWAPHFSYMRQAAAKGLIGEVVSARITLHWDHTWTAATPFNTTPHLALFDFGIHWFDLVCALLPDRKPRRVFASTETAPGQAARPPLLAHAVIDYDGAQASIAMNGAVRAGGDDHTVVAGTTGLLTGRGPALERQRVTLATAAGAAGAALEGDWAANGFQGTMCGLLDAIAHNRRHYNSARENLDSLALCFAAVASSVEGVPKTPWTVRRLPE